MPWYAEHILSAYFKFLGLSCSSQKPAIQRRLSIYLLFLLGEMLIQAIRYFRSDYQMNDFQDILRKQFGSYIKVIDGMNFAYLLTHMLLVSQALLWRNRERALIAQLPHIDHHDNSNKLINIRYCFIFETFITGSAFILAITQIKDSRHPLSNFRYVYCTQGVRARYTQLMLLVVRLDAHLLVLLQKQQQLAAIGHHCNLDLSTSYAHLVRLARQLSRLYGLSVLLMNVLCIGDLIMVFYAYIVLSQLTDKYISWLLVWQTLYIMMPTLFKIWQLCVACDKCAKRSQQILLLLNRPSPMTEGRRLNANMNMAIKRDLINGFALQVMQNPIKFDVCGIYNLNIQTLAGIFLFMLESLVIFLQFVTLTQKYYN